MDVKVAVGVIVFVCVDVGVLVGVGVGEVVGVEVGLLHMTVIGPPGLDTFEMMKPPPTTGAADVLPHALLKVT